MSREHMAKTRFWCCEIAKMLAIHKKSCLSWSLKTMVRAVLGGSMRIKDIAKT